MITRRQLTSIRMFEGRIGIGNEKRNLLSRLQIIHIFAENKLCTEFILELFQRIFIDESVP